MAFDRLITFERSSTRFVYRAAAVLMDGDRVLLQRVEEEQGDFWCLPGGRVELLEPARESLLREMREELGEEVRIQRLLWVIENFFQHQGASWHEVGLYFLATLADDSRLLRGDGPFFGLEPEAAVRFELEWRDRTGLEEIPLFPAFLRRALRSLPAAPEHVAHRD